MDTFAQGPPRSRALDHCDPANLWQAKDFIAPKIASVCGPPAQCRRRTCHNWGLLIMADSVSTRPRQQADFRFAGCASQGQPRRIHGKPGLGHQRVLVKGGCTTSHRDSRGHREDPHSPGSEGQGITAGVRPRVAAASGLRPASQHVSCGPVTRAAGIGCARAFQSRGLAPHRSGNPQGDRFEKRTSALLSAFKVRQLDPRNGSVGDGEPPRRAREKGCLKALSSDLLNRTPHAPAPGPRKPRPARTPRCLPPCTVTTPLTTTASNPSDIWCGFSKVARSRTVFSSNTTISAA